MQVRPVSNQYNYNKKPSFKAATMIIEESVRPFFERAAANSADLCVALNEVEREIVFMFGKTDKPEGFFIAIKKGVQGMNTPFGYTCDFNGIKTDEHFAFIGNSAADGIRQVNLRG